MNSPRQQLCGQLYKYTNVVKGWQYRWFMVDNCGGNLSYYLFDSSNDELANPSNPRGQVSLAGASICPSDEDSRTFSISCASGDTLKLRAADARERQEWVDGLRAISESHTLAIASETNLPARDQLAAYDALGAARQQLQQTELSNASLGRMIESLESTELLPTDPDLLLLKALSAANTYALLQCLGILQREHDYSNNKSSDQFR